MIYPSKQPAMPALSFSERISKMVADLYRRPDQTMAPTAPSNKTDRPRDSVPAAGPPASAVPIHPPHATLGHGGTTDINLGLATQNVAVFIDWKATRDTGDMETGTVHVVNDGTNASVAPQPGAVLANGAGISNWDASISGSDLIVSITLDSSNTVNADFSYTLRRDNT